MEVIKLAVWFLCGLIAAIINYKYYRKNDENKNDLSIEGLLFSLFLVMYAWFIIKTFNKNKNN
jgi:hypothetical protein